MIEQASLIIGDGNWAVKSDSLLGYKLIDGKYYPRQMSATRATTATRINAQGLVELVPYNFVRYSQEISNTGYWAHYLSTLTANTTTAPDGTLTADTISITGSSGSAYQFYTYSGGIHTLSCYFKKINEDNVYIDGNSSSGYYGATFNLTTQAITLFGGGFSPLIESVGNGWYRCSVQADGNGSGSYGFGVYAGAGQSAYIWGAQLNEGTIKTYLPTTDRLDIPRIDYSTGSSALLAEPQRTNLITYSEDFSQANWLYLNSSFSANSIVSPSGTTSADTILETTANGVHQVYNITTSSSGTYAASIFIKRKNNRYVAIQLSDFATGELQCIFDFDNSSISTSVSGSWTNAFFDFEELQNDWFRIKMSGTQNAGSVVAFVTRLLNDSLQSSYVGNVNNGVYIWGAQLEAGSYATSYIPTTSTSVTRNADVLSYSSLNSLDVTTTTNYTWFLDLGNDTIVNNFDIRLGGIGLYLIGTGSQGTQWSLYNFTSLNQILSNTNITGNRKICLTYNSGVLKVFANNQLLTTYSGSITSDVLTFLMSNADNRLVLNTLAIFNTTLSDTDALNLIS